LESPTDGPAEKVHKVESVYLSSVFVFNESCSFRKFFFMFMSLLFVYFITDVFICI